VDRDVPALIERAKELCDELARRLPTTHSPAAHQSFVAPNGRVIVAKIPTKLATVLGALAWRAKELADLSHELFKRDHLVPAIILTRALMESTALLYTVFKKTTVSIEARELATIDEYLVRCLAGSRKNANDPQSPNVLTAVQHLEKEDGCDGFLAFYETLCEFAHPNSLGTFYAYADYNELDRRVSFGPGRGLTEPNDAAFAAVFALEVLISFYDKTTALLPAVSALSAELYDDA